MSITADRHRQNIRADGADGREVMNLVRELGFNPRDLETWRSLDMDAVTFRSDQDLLGAIPYERRVLQVAPGLALRTAHESVVGLRPELRGRGTGSSMQDALAAAAPEGLNALTVFREKPESGAYRWYRANSFDPVVRIDSRLLDDPSTAAGDPIDVREVGAGADLPWEALDRYRASVFADRSGGHIARPTRELRTWLQVHPYRTNYRFLVASIGKFESPDALAVCGVGRLHSAGDRLEILELCSTGWAPEPAVELVRGLCRHAADRGLTPVRWALAETDPFTSIADSVGFTARWSFEMLVRPLAGPTVDDLRTAAAETPWRYQSIDYI